MTEGREQPDDVIADVVEGEVVSAEESVDTTPPPTAEELGLVLDDDPTIAVEQLIVEVANSRRAADERLHDLKRVAADFENFRRRSQRDQMETTQRAAEQVVARLLPALDSFDAALGVETSTEAEAKMMGGMVRTHQQLLTILEGLGLTVIAAVGETFDPTLHEAVTSPAEGEGDLIVGQELRRGYLLKERLVRPALVALEYQGA